EKRTTNKSVDEHGCALLGANRRAVADFLDTGNDERLARLQAVAHHVVVALQLSNLDWLLLGNQPALGAGLGNEAEVLAADADDCGEGDGKALRAAPDDPRPDELL